MSANWQHCHPILTTELTHLDNIPVVAASRGKRQDAHVRNSVLFGPVQLQVVRQANVAVDTLFPFDNSYVHLATCRLAEIFVGSFENVNPSTNDLQFYVLRESFHWNLDQHTVSRYEPFAEKVGSFHHQLIEAGIWDLWIQLLSERYAKRTSELVTNRLSFDDLISLWFILLSGFVISGVALIF
ncbi:conserved hypothetical protein [Culex quinquefasciatus]|uniref:Uncharacterized protein n=1 Tax=Culex quinquefasciatus TaxID=7176 RepID=B0XCC0_CULQU|nr:conserved hypothetical protein [Culex quinquefasciatus]|eukprot:XP_001867292.1 conserved hypothetical protein [Culex quinquefasciatus]